MMARKRDGNREQERDGVKKRNRERERGVKRRTE